MSEELWTEVCDTEQEVVTKTIPKKKKCKKAKWLSEGALQIAVKRREVKGNYTSDFIILIPFYPFNEMADIFS